MAIAPKATKGLTGALLTLHIYKKTADRASTNFGQTQPRSQGFSLFVIGKAGKGPGTGRSHDFQHPDIVGVINYNNNELENPRWPPT